MTVLTMQLIAILMLAGSSAGPPTEEGVSPERIDIALSVPHTGDTPPLAAWSDRFHREVIPVLAAWAHFRKRLQGDLPARFNRQCVGLEASLEKIDRSVVLPAPDLLIDLYVRRLLLHLDAAVHACSRGELFNVVYRLDEAGAALGETRWLLALRGLGP